MDINETNPVATSVSMLKSSTNSNPAVSLGSCYPSYEYTTGGLLVPHDQYADPSTTAMEYYYDNQGCANQQNCFMFSTMSYPFAQPNAAVAAPANNSPENCVYYQIVNNAAQGYRWTVPTKHPSYSRWIPSDYAKDYEGCEYHPMMESQQYCKGDSLLEKSGSDQGAGLRPRISSKMHPVQLLHQIFRKEAFVMEYERINDGPFSQVRVTYKVNGKTYTAEATRLKEARRLCAKLVLQDQFPDLKIEVDNDIPQPEYDVKQFDNKHPVQILYQIFKYEPMEMHCEEEGAAHFAKHIFTFVIRGKKYVAKAETIKEAKRRAAIIALNEYLKKEQNS